MTSAQHRYVWSRRRPHRFVPDLEVGREYQPLHRRRHGLTPRAWCARCGLPGQPGDARHPTMDPGLLAAAAERDERILGERPDRDEETRGHRDP